MTDWKKTTDKNVFKKTKELEETISISDINDRLQRKNEILAALENKKNKIESHISAMNNSISDLEQLKQELLSL
jgi:predicted  nucleic acid-binding Zn-ribbon protein